MLSGVELKRVRGIIVFDVSSLRIVVSSSGLTGSLNCILRRGRESSITGRDPPVTCKIISLTRSLRSELVIDLAVMVACGPMESRVILPCSIASRPNSFVAVMFTEFSPSTSWRNGKLKL